MSQQISGCSAVRKHFPRYLAGGIGKEEAIGDSCSGQQEKDCSLLTYRSTSPVPVLYLSGCRMSQQISGCCSVHNIYPDTWQKEAAGASCSGQHEKNCSLLTYRSTTPVLYLLGCRMSQQISGCSAVHANISPDTWQEEEGRRKLQEPFVAVRTK
jgi:hypothetical protein